MTTPCRTNAEALSLFEANKRLAYYFVHRHRHLAAVRRLGDEAEQVALVALWKAARGYDDAIGSFVGYASLAIRRDLLHAAFGSRRPMPTFSDVEHPDSPIDPAAPGEPDALLAEGLRAEVGRLLTYLPRRSRVIVTLRYGLDGRGQRTLDETASVLNISRERARQLQESAIERLRQRVIRQGQHVESLPSP